MTTAAVECPYCRDLFLSDHAWVGSKVVCPKCHSTLLCVTGPVDARVMQMDVEWLDRSGDAA